MSGHNKWSKIKHKKAVTDAQKSKVFSKLVKLIQVEAKIAGGNKDAPGLRSAIDKAKKENMPNINIDRAIEKGTKGEGTNLESTTYEVFGPAGSGIIIEALTDNKNRTTAEIKHLLSKKGYSLSTPGSVSWMFIKQNSEWKANTTIDLSEEDKEKLEELLEEIKEHEDVNEVYSNL